MNGKQPCCSPAERKNHLGITPVLTASKHFGTEYHRIITKASVRLNGMKYLRLDQQNIPRMNLYFPVADSHNSFSVRHIIQLPLPMPVKRHERKVIRDPAFIIAVWHKIRAVPALFVCICLKQILIFCHFSCPFPKNIELYYFFIEL